MKEKIAKLRSSMRLKWQNVVLKFRQLWRDPHEALLFRTLFVGGVLSGSMTLGLALGFLFMGSPSREVASVDVPAEVEAAESSDAGAAPIIGAAKPIPREILDQRDGIEEPGKDLKEKVFKAASAVDADGNIKVAPYNPFVTYQNILGSTREGVGRVGRVAISVAFEVDSHGAKKELEAKKKEISAMISNLIAEQEFDYFKKGSGRIDLKRRIYHEVNFKLKKGQIKDVLYTSFVLK